MYGDPCVIGKEKKEKEEEEMFIRRLGGRGLSGTESVRDKREASGTNE